MAEQLQQPNQSSSSPLSVVHEREEAEALAARLEEAESALEESRQEVQHRLKDLIELESELVNRDIRISSLNEQLDAAKVRKFADN